MDQLKPGKELIKIISDQFRHRTPFLEIVSFWEQKGIRALGVCFLLMLINQLDHREGGICYNWIAEGESRSFEWKPRGNMQIQINKRCQLYHSFRSYFENQQASNYSLTVRVKTLKLSCINNRNITSHVPNHANLVLEECNDELHVKM